MLLAALSIVLMTLDHQHRHIDSVRQVLSLAVSPVYYVVHMPITAYQFLSEELQTKTKLVIENKKLRSENLLLHAREQKIISLEKENARLKALLKSSARAGDKVLVAKLLQIDPDPFSHRVVVDKGKRDGLYVGQPVLDAHGVVGQIVKVGPFSSVALLITDMSHAIPIQSNRSGTRSIATGSGSFDQIELSHVTSTSDLQEGDLLVTSGLGKRFPEGYPVGVITEIIRNTGQPFIQVKVKPSAQLDKTREVLLLWPEGIEPKISNLLLEQNKAIS